jgi:hypothetical protein
MRSNGRQRTAIGWVIGGALVALLGVAGLDALRSSDREPTAAPSPSEVATTTETQTAADATGTIAGPDLNEAAVEYSARAAEICQAANARLNATELVGAPSDTEQAAASMAVARIAEDALSQLWALSPPEASREGVNQVLTLMKYEIVALRQWAAALAAGKTARAETLGMERVHLTHSKDLVIRELALRSRGINLFGCPISLPA